MSFLRGLAVGAVLLTTANISVAGVITGGSLLDGAGADQLETWLGSGDLDFTNVYAGVTGDSVAGFHAVADGVGATFSIYEIEFVASLGGGTALVGGYTQNDWGANSGSTADSTAFIFNLTTLEMQSSQEYPQNATIIYDHFFPTFGLGYDLYAGGSTLGSYGYAYSSSYDWSQGSIAFAGDSASGWGGGASCTFNCFTVTALDVYTFANAASVPEPASIALMGLGLAGLGFSRRKKMA